MNDRFITRDGVALELENRELEETAVPFRVREVLEEFAEASRWRRKREEWLAADCFATLNPEDKARKVRENYRAIHTERGQAYKIAKERARRSAWAKRQRKEGTGWAERQRASGRRWRNKNGWKRNARRRAQRAALKVAREAAP